jgi:hypothetical protein
LEHDVIVVFDDMELDIDLKIERKNCSTKIVNDLSQFNFLFSKIHRMDIQKEYTAIKIMFKGIGKNKINSCIDYMSGCGFSGRAIQKYLTNNVVLNDMSVECFDVLNKNFTKVLISNEELKKSSSIKKFDLSFLDFNNFTLKKIEKYDYLFTVINKSKYIILTDSACYGFKMGNLKRYGFKYEEEYYFKLSYYLKSKLSRVIQFGNAALVLLNHEKEFEKIEKINKLEPFLWRFERGLF